MAGVSFAGMERALTAPHRHVANVATVCTLAAKTSVSRGNFFIRFFVYIYAWYFSLYFFICYHLVYIFLMFPTDETGWSPIFPLPQDSD